MVKSDKLPISAPTAPANHGLYRSTSPGYRVRDLFENIVTYAEQNRIAEVRRLHKEEARRASE
jgi:hypothetical protein